MAIFSAYLVFLGIHFASGMLVQSCTIENCVDMGIMERVAQSDYVVYRKTLNHKANKVEDGNEYYYAIDAIFEVFVVIKPGEGINELITISRIAPQDECAGTPVHSLLAIGDHAIVALQKSSNGEFLLHEVMPKKSAAVQALKPYFFSLAKVCDMQIWEPPIRARTNRCPICGFSDFDTEIRTLDNSVDDVTVCMSTTNTIATNMTECELYMEYTIEQANAQNCVPANSTKSCTVLLYRESQATCVCSAKEKKVEIDVGQGVQLLPSFFIIFGLFIFLGNL